LKTIPQRIPIEKSMIFFLKFDRTFTIIFSSLFGKTISRESFDDITNEFNCVTKEGDIIRSNV
jgi:hypothetical protein